MLAAAAAAVAVLNVMWPRRETSSAAGDTIGGEPSAGTTESRLSWTTQRLPCVLSSRSCAGCSRSISGRGSRPTSHRVAARNAQARVHRKARGIAPTAPSSQRSPGTTAPPGERARHLLESAPRHPADIVERHGPPYRSDGRYGRAASADRRRRANMLPGGHSAAPGQPKARDQLRNLFAVVRVIVGKLSEHEAFLDVDLDLEKHDEDRERHDPPLAAPQQ